MEGDVIITQDVFVYEIARRGRQRQADRPPPLDRHRPAALLGARPLLRRGEAARRGARRGRSRRRAVQDAGEVAMAMQTARHVLPGRARRRRRRLGVRLSDPVGRAAGREAPGERRAHRAGRRAPPARATAEAAPRQVEQTLKELEARQKTAEEPAARDAHRAGGPELDRSASSSSSASASASSLFVVLFLVGGGLLVGGRCGLSPAASACRAGSWPILKKRRESKFLDEFPDAIDVIVRGVKAGLPLGDCLRIIANEAPEPVKSEFRDHRRVRRRSACRWARPAPSCSSACRCRRRTSSAS